MNTISWVVDDVAAKVDANVAVVTKVDANVAVVTPPPPRS